MSSRKESPLPITREFRAKSTYAYLDYAAKPPADIVDKEGHLLVGPVFIIEQKDEVICIRCNRQLDRNFIESSIPSPVYTEMFVYGKGPLTIDTKSKEKQTSICIAEAKATYIPRCVLDTILSEDVHAYTGRERFADGNQVKTAIEEGESQLILRKATKDVKLTLIPDLPESWTFTQRPVDISEKNDSSN